MSDLVCHYCDLTPSSIREYLRHCSSHKGISGFKFWCPTCSRNFKTVKQLQKHGKDCFDVPVPYNSEVGLQKLAEWLKGSAHECLSSCKASPLNENTAVRADL